MDSEFPRLVLPLLGGAGGPTAVVEVLVQHPEAVPAVSPWSAVRHQSTRSLYPVQSELGYPQVLRSFPGRREAYPLPSIFTPPFFVDGCY